MTINRLTVVVMTIGVFCSCEQKSTAPDKPTVPKDSIVLSFAFMGCNRVDHSDRRRSDPVYHSTANAYALSRIFEDLTAQKNLPTIFFFLGDVVLGESDTATLNQQLKGWVDLYNASYDGNMRNKGIEFIAVPGNHEMLHDYPEVPLAGTTTVWLRHMSSYMPVKRDGATGDSLDNRSTYSFVRNHTGFIVMNTDSYSYALPRGGKEGQVPLKWIIEKIQAYRADTSIHHLFVLGHKPYYVFCKPSTGHSGLPDGAALWNTFRQSKVTAMLSAHVHDYQRVQPGGDGGPYQIVAGNGGSVLDGRSQNDFYGYTLIQLMSNGDAKLISRGYKIGDPYYSKNNSGPFVTVDSTILTWSKNPTSFTKYICD